MKEIRQKLTTIVVTVALVLTAFFVMATPISRNQVKACAGIDQEVDVGELVQFDGTCSFGVGNLWYKWYFGDGLTGSGPTPNHIYSIIGPGPSLNLEGVFHATLLVKDGNNVFDLDTVKITVKNEYPEADAGTDMFVDEDETVWFDNSGSSDLNNDIVITNWNFGDGTDEDATINSVIDHVFEKEGEYPVTLTVTDNDGAMDTDTILVTVRNLVPSADGIANGEIDDDITINEDDIVAFDASGSSDTPSDLASLKYGWDFGDGSKGKGLGTTHKYTKQGVYPVTLTVTDDNDESAQDTMTIRVLNAPPTADAGSDQSVYEGDTVFFDATGSADTSSDKAILDYSWSFGAGGTRPTHGWYDDSVNNVDLVVEDDDGLQDMDSVIITVQNIPPVASIDGVYVLVDFTLRAAGEKWHNVIVTLSEQSLQTPVVEVLRTPGSPNDQSKTAEDVYINIAEDVVANVYYTPWDDPVNGSPNGATPVWLTLTYEDGTSYTLFKSFNVQKPEEWNWTHDMNEYVLEQPLHFNGTVYDPGADDIKVRWDFDDGTAPIVNDYVSGGNHPMRISEHYVHMFPVGSFVVTLEATDDEGGCGTMSVTVTKTDSLTSTNIAPKAISSGGATTLEDDQITLVGIGEDSGSDQGILIYTWDLGDGTVVNTPTVTHAYARAGIYYPTLVIEDDEGAIGVASELVEVLNVVPTAIANADKLNVTEDEMIHFNAFSSIDTPSDLSILRYAWDFGDGSKGYGTATIHVYSKEGTYQAILSAKDDNGASSTSELTVNVENMVPYDIEINTKSTMHEDEVILFEGIAEDSPSDVPLLKYSWKFGDGTTGKGTNPTHMYTEPGNYTVSLKVKDDDGAIAVTDVHINVKNVEPIAYGGLSKSYYGPQMVVIFDGRGFDTHSDQSTLTYQWKFGDGSSSTSALAGHIYPTESSESYTARLRVEDIHGGSDTYYVTVNIKVDSDGDQLLNGEELELGTDPYNFDTDGDWLIDYYELNPSSGKPATDPKKADADRDGCTDWEEIWPGRDGYITDPNDPDMDGDGLKDCDEVYAKIFKSEKRFSIGDPTTGEGVVEVPLHLVRSSTGPNHIVAVEAKVGISHTDISELKISIDNGVTSAVLRDSEASNDITLFESYDLTAAGFPAPDFAVYKTWTLIVEDQVAGNPKGYVEYFEIYILSALNPMDPDTDDDGLNDSEEANLGDDGWYTDPWDTDTDNDGLSDYLEPRGWSFYLTKTVYETPNGFKTDPTRNDTDRDGVLDGDDWNPLRNMMVEVALGNFTPLDDDEAPGDDTEAFVGIGVGIDHFIESQMLWTDRHTTDTGVTVDMNRQYTFEVDDSTRFHNVIISTWDDDTAADDDELDIIQGSPNRYEAMYDLIQGTIDDTSDDELCLSDAGNGDGVNEDFDAALEWCISTVRPRRIRTVLLNSTDAVTVHETADGLLRCTGEQEFYLVLLDITSAPLSPDSPLWRRDNAIIIPRRVFVNSKLNSMLNDSTYPAFVGNLAFSANSVASLWTTGSVVGTIHGTLTGPQSDDLFSLLTEDESGNQIAASNVVTHQLMTLNLDDYVLNLIPLAGILFNDATGEDPDGALESATEFVEEMVEAIMNCLLAVLEFFERLTEFLTRLGMMVLDKINDAIDWVMDAINFITGLLLDFIVKVIDWIIDILVNYLLPIFAETAMQMLKIMGGPDLEEFGRRVFGRAFDAIGTLLTWIADDFLPAMAAIIKGLMEAGADLFKMIQSFGECIGDLTLETLDDVPGQACMEILSTLEGLGYTLWDIIKEALQMLGTGLAAIIQLVLDSCGIISGARQLNATEEDAAEQIFWNSSLDITKIRIGDSTGCANFIGMIQEVNGEALPFTLGYLITIPGQFNWTTDVLIHEMMHSWQYVEGGLDYALDSIILQASDPDGYNYGYIDEPDPDTCTGCYNGTGGEDDLLNASGDLYAFNVEQQAMIIQHYYVRRFVENLDPSLYAAWELYWNVVDSS